MERIYNPKYILYFILPGIGALMGIGFFVGNVPLVGGVLLALSLATILLYGLSAPRYYRIDEEGVRIYYGVGRCNFIPWNTIEAIHARYDPAFDLFFWVKDYVITTRASRRTCVKMKNTVTKTKKTTALIEKYWSKGIV